MSSVLNETANTYILHVNLSTLVHLRELPIIGHVCAEKCFSWIILITGLLIEVGTLGPVQQIPNKLSSYDPMSSVHYLVFANFVRGNLCWCCSGPWRGVNFSVNLLPHFTYSVVSFLLLGAPILFFRASLVLKNTTDYHSLVRAGSINQIINLIKIISFSFIRMLL